MREITSLLYRGGGDALESKLFYPVAAKSSVEKTAAATTGKRDKYIWDIYDEESENTVVKLEDNDVGPTSDDGVPTGQKRAPVVLPGDARRQLSELKIAAETIAKQFEVCRQEK